MSEVKRYKLLCGTPGDHKRQDECGEWMKFKDHAAVVAAKDAEIQSLLECIGDIDDPVEIDRFDNDLFKSHDGKFCEYEDLKHWTACYRKEIQSLRAENAKLEDERQDAESCFQKSFEAVAARNTSIKMKNSALRQARAYLDNEPREQAERLVGEIDKALAETGGGEDG